MKNAILSIFLIFHSILLVAQFEQKVSINLSSGVFNTFGAKTYKPVWATLPEDYEPTQMPNYKPGIMAQGGVQFNLNRRLSIEANVEMMYAGKWFYPAYDDVNHLDFTIYDTVTHILLKKGSNELNLLNFRLGFTPKYYLLPGKRWNPYLFMGFTFNYSSANYQDNEWKALRDLNQLAIDDTGPSNPYLENNLGIGFKPGAGVEYRLGDKAGFYLSTGIDYILLNKSSFNENQKKENFTSFFLQAGVRLSFIKSKML